MIFSECVSQNATHDLSQKAEKLCNVIKLPKNMINQKKTKKLCILAVMYRMQKHLKLRDVNVYAICRAVSGIGHFVNLGVPKSFCIPY